MVRAIEPGKRKLVDPGLLEIAEQGSRVGLMEYLDAVKQRVALGAQMRAFHRKIDLLVTPTLAVPAFEAGREVADAKRQRRWIDWTPFTYPFNMTRNPAASVPAGMHSDGLPMAIQLVGRYFEDRTVLRAARAIERARPWKMPAP